MEGHGGVFAAPLCDLLKYKFYLQNFVMPLKAGNSITEAPPLKAAELLFGAGRPLGLTSVILL